MWLNSAADLEERVRFARAAAGERADDIEWNLLVQRVVITDDHEQITAELHEQFAPELTPAEFAEHPTILVGTVEQTAAKLNALRDRTGISNITVSEPDLTTFAPVIELLRSC